MTTNPPAGPSPAAREAPLPAEPVLHELERAAVEFARLAGAEITTSLGRTLAVRYKGAADAAPLDPVSEVDHHVETVIRARLAERFPDHEVLGEELDAPSSGTADYLWAIDPIDGTANFVNGFPLFAASIGVLHRGRPVVGAIWCASTHALRPGVYHACRQGPLHFEEEELRLHPNPAVRRRLAGEPQAVDSQALPWDVRKTGSAAIECAFVAAGLLRVARFERPNVWDVAGGLVLALASGRAIRVETTAGWAAFDRFEVPPGAPLRSWRRSLVLGERGAVELRLQGEPRA
jgi:myo-inositol-1(or 4)-monophosphatase